jgi:hypothetical protein
MKEEKIVLFKERKQELVKKHDGFEIIIILCFVQIEEVKTKETYAVAKNLLEKYGEKITSEVRSPVMNGNSKGISHNRDNELKNRLFSRSHKKTIEYRINTLSFRSC